MYIAKSGWEFICHRFNEDVKTFHFLGVFFLMRCIATASTNKTVTRTGTTAT